MQNFSIGVQVKKELEDFNNKKVKLASTVLEDSGVRTLKKNAPGYYHNQRETIALIDLAYNSEFENGPRDSDGKLKLYMNIGKFRSEVSSKQVDLDVKDFQFTPDDYADPWTAFFLQKDFTEWSRDSELGELINQCVEAFPKYGSVVLKKVNKELAFVPLQNLKNEQTAKSLKTARYIIEEHPDMAIWEIEDMDGWDTTGFEMDYDETVTVYERYGRVPLSWLKKQNNQKVDAGDDKKYVDAMVIMAYAKNDMKNAKQAERIFFAEQITERPYRECHWSRQHGRWLGIGVIEDTFPNQKAKNIIVNLIRKSMQWSARRNFQTANTDLAGKSFVADFKDGELIEVGMNGEIKEINFAAKTNADFTTFLNEFEKNSDQKCFTFEVATGEALPSGTPFRLGVILSNAVNSFFGLKREKLGLMFKSAMLELVIPQFLKDMDNENRVIEMFSDSPGYEALKAAVIDYVKSETCRISLLSGKPVDAHQIAQAVAPFVDAAVIPFLKQKHTYAKSKWKFNLNITGEDENIERKIETYKTLYTVMSQQGDSRADKVLERLAALTGVNMSTLGPKTPPLPTPAPTGTPSPYTPAAPEATPAQ